MVGAELQRRRSPETRASTAIKGKQQGAPRPCTLETKPLWRMGVDEGSSDRSFRRAGVSVGPEFPSDRSFRRTGVSVGPEPGRTRTLPALKNTSSIRMPSAPYAS